MAASDKIFEGLKISFLEMVRELRQRTDIEITEYWEPESIKGDLFSGLGAKFQELPDEVLAFFRHFGPCTLRWEVPGSDPRVHGECHFPDPCELVEIWEENMPYQPDLEDVLPMEFPLESDFYGVRWNANGETEMVRVGTDVESLGISLPEYLSRLIQCNTYYGWRLAFWSDQLGREPLNGSVRFRNEVQQLFPKVNPADYFPTNYERFIIQEKKTVAKIKEKVETLKRIFLRENLEFRLEEQRPEQPVFAISGTVIQISLLNLCVEEAYGYDYKIESDIQIGAIRFQIDSFSEDS